MWPFTGKKTADITLGQSTLAGALDQLARIGISVRSGISNQHLLETLGGTMDSTVNWKDLLCVLGSDCEVRPGEYEAASDDIWLFDTESIDVPGSYINIVNGFITLARGALPLTDLHDHVDLDNQSAWFKFILDGKIHHWNLEVNEDWVDPNLYPRLQELVVSRGGDEKFFLTYLGQDCLICFGDDRMRQALSDLSGMQFNWE
jgi:hypothetical protein